MQPQPIGPIQPQPWYSDETRTAAEALNEQIEQHDGNVGQLDEQRRQLRDDDGDADVVLGGDIARQTAFDLMRAEVAIRRQLADHYKRVAADAQKAGGQAFAAIDKARADVLAKLHAAGYVGTPDTYDVRVPGSVSQGMVNFHPSVHAARNRQNELQAAGRIAHDQGRVNTNRVAELEQSIAATRERAAAV